MHEPIITEITATVRILLPSGEKRDVRVLITPEHWQQVGDSREALEIATPVTEALSAAAVPHLTDEEAARDAEEDQP